MGSFYLFLIVAGKRFQLKDLHLRRCPTFGQTKGLRSQILERQTWNSTFWASILSSGSKYNVSVVFVSKTRIEWWDVIVHRTMTHWPAQSRRAQKQKQTVPLSVLYLSNMHNTSTQLRCLTQLYVLYVILFRKPFQ